MQVVVSLKIELDATGQFSHMERQIQEVGREAMKEAFKTAIHQREDQQRNCPGCGSA